MSAAMEGILRGLRSLFQWWIVVTPWEQAVRVRAGKHVLVLESGIHLRIPLIDRFFVQSTRKRITDLPIQTITTADGVTLTLKGQLAYQIENIGRLYDTLHDAEGTIVNMAQAATADLVTSAKRRDCEPRELGRSVTSSLVERLLDYGLADVEFTVTDFADVKTYRLITQDIWSNTGPSLNTRDHHTGEGMPL